jgi:hypothetical protein
VLQPFKSGNVLQPHQGVRGGGGGLLEGNRAGSIAEKDITHARGCA